MSTKTDIASTSSTFHYLMIDFWRAYGDPRTGTFPLMNNFAVPLFTVAFFLFFVLYLGPRLMANKRPFSLKHILVPYNLSLALFNFYVFVRILMETNYGRRLLEVDFKPQDDTSQEMFSRINLGWLYVLSKFVDMFDTVFFILRKKQSQVTGLHVFHHASVPLLAWIYLRISAEHVTAVCFAFLNSPVHTAMYAYYGLAALGPQVQKYLWFKRYITQMQIVQFILLFTHGVYFCLTQTGYHWFFSLDIIFQTSLYLVLFTRFYLRTYQQGSSDKGKKEKHMMSQERKNI